MRKGNLHLLLERSGAGSGPGLSSGSSMSLFWSSYGPPCYHLGGGSCSVGDHIEKQEEITPYDRTHFWPSTSQ